MKPTTLGQNLLPLFASLFERVMTNEAVGINPSATHKVSAGNAYTTLANLEEVTVEEAVLKCVCFNPSGLSHGGLAV